MSLLHFGFTRWSHFIMDIRHDIDKNNIYEITAFISQKKIAEIKKTSLFKMLNHVNRERIKLVFKSWNNFVLNSQAVRKFKFQLISGMLARFLYFNRRIE